jgi:hypothetical protein
MADFFSTQITAIDAQPTQNVRGRENGAFVRSVAYNWTGDAAQNDEVYLCELPEGARIVGGQHERTALGSSVTINYRTDTTNLAFNTGGAIDGSAAGVYLTNTAASGVGYIVGSGANNPGKERVRAILGGANPASGTLRGHIFYTLG